MELTDIMALVKAGYTKDEISQMELKHDTVPVTEPTPVDIIEPIKEPTPAQVVEPVATPAPTPTPTPTPAPVPAQQQEQPSMSDIMQSIAKLTSAVQANAIAQSVMPQGLSNPPSAEDMIAEIIRPTYKERG